MTEGDFWRTVIAVAALVVGVVSLVWQASRELVDGPIVRVYDDADMKIRSDGSIELVITIRAVNIGHKPTTIHEMWSVIGDGDGGGATPGMNGQPGIEGPELPVRIEASDHLKWTVTAYITGWTYISWHSSAVFIVRPSWRRRWLSMRLSVRQLGRTTGLRPPWTGASRQALTVGGTYRLRHHVWAKDPPYFKRGGRLGMFWERLQISTVNRLPNAWQEARWNRGAARRDRRNSRLPSRSKRPPAPPPGDGA